MFYGDFVPIRDDYFVTSVHYEIWKGIVKAGQKLLVLSVVEI